MKTDLPAVINGPVPVVAPFDYGSVDTTTAARLREAAANIRRIQARDVLEIGTVLLTVKQALPHGAFAAWCEAELRIGARSAENYMAATRFLDGKPEPVSHLPPKLLYRLASPSTSPEVVAEVVQSVVTGATPEVIRHRLDVADAERREVSVQQRRHPNKSEAETRAAVAQRRKRMLAEREKREAEYLRERDEREARRQDGIAVLARVASANPDAVSAVLEAAELFRANDMAMLLRDALAGVGARVGAA